MTTQAIVPSNKLEKLAKKHFDLVEKLKKVLILSQLGFIEAGHYLYEIKISKSYITEDSSQDVSFTDFLSRPDIPLPGHTIESRVRVAQALLRIYKIFKLKYSRPSEELAEIGWTKLDLIARPCDEENANIEEWMAKAKTLSIRDLLQEISGNGKTLSENAACQHRLHPEWINEIHLWKCKQCGTIWKSDPRIEWKKKKKNQTKLTSVPK
jgi:hypothetical protein